MNKKNADQKRDGAFDDDIETASVMSDHSDCSTSGFDPTTGTWVVASRSDDYQGQIHAMEGVH